MATAAPLASLAPVDVSIDVVGVPVGVNARPMLAEVVFRPDSGCRRVGERIDPVVAAVEVEVQVEEEAERDVCTMPECV